MSTPSPYEFGLAVGAYMQKRANDPNAPGFDPSAGRSWLGFARDGLIGEGGVMGTNHLDPTQRGLATDLLAYSNPISGVVTGVNDTGRHLYNGRYLDALGSVGMTALSFLPGVGGAIGKGIGRGIMGGVRTGGKALMARGMTGAGKGAIRGAAGMRQMASAGGKIMSRPGAGWIAGGASAAPIAGAFMPSGQAPAQAAPPGGQPQQPQQQQQPSPLLQQKPQFRPRPML